MPRLVVAKFSPQRPCKALPSKDFLGKDRTFPGQNKSHLEAKIRGRAPKSANAGNISRSAAKNIQAKARATIAFQSKLR